MVKVRGQTAIDKLVRPAVLRGREEAEISQVEEVDSTKLKEWNGVKV